MSNRNNAYLQVKRNRQSFVSAIEKAEKRQKRVGKEDQPKHKKAPNQPAQSFKATPQEAHAELEEYAWNKSIDSQSEQLPSEMKYSLKININKEKEQKVKELLKGRAQGNNKGDSMAQSNKRDRMKRRAFNFVEKGSIEKKVMSMAKIKTKQEPKGDTVPLKEEGDNTLPHLNSIRPRYAANTVKLTANDLIPDIEPWDIQYIPQGVTSFTDNLPIDANELSLDYFINEVNHHKAEIEAKVTSLVYHPIPLKSDYLEKLNKTVLPVFLTQKEQKRIRRLRKIGKLKDTQEKIKLGLMKPKPEKLKYSNFHKLFKDDSITDPSQLELKVKKAYEERYSRMQKENEKRKLTKEQRADKLKRKYERDSKKECRGCVFRVDCLSSTLNRCKIDKNSKQLYLTGLCLMTRAKNAFPSMIYIEGGPRAIRKMTRLLLGRIKWKESENDSKANCALAWEGNIKKRLFDKWEMKEIKSESDAIKILSEKNLENIWHLMTSYIN